MADSLRMMDDSERPVEMSKADLAARLDYVAQAYHIAMHGINEAPDWKACRHQPCKVANQGFPALASEPPPSGTALDSPIVIAARAGEG